ncbi:uncharacterized protein LOC124260996 [Haliotis rubra]|uniref:uncharacterized protein LOC124260996 n=1 Tax=Haliotis rubra TaxID=36100 RepID=UPI001EE5FC77|nr:uncharacterized protein LOC124260996 [Haliotis rubra]
MAGQVIQVIYLLAMFKAGICVIPLIQCFPKTTCSCHTGEGTIDLHPLANTDGTPRFRDIADPDGKTFYSWNPCYGFDEVGCWDVAVCKITDHGVSSVSLGPQSSVHFVVDSVYGQLLKYTQWGSANYSGIIILTCDHTEEGVVTRRPNSDFGSYFYLELRSKHACPIKINGSTTAPPTESTKRYRRPITPAFIRPAITPSKPSPAPLLDLNTLGTVSICLIVLMVLLIILVSTMFCCLYRRLNAIAGQRSSHKLSSVTINGKYGMNDP